MELSKKLLLLLCISFIVSNSINAQFLKKLQKSVAESIENAAIDQTANTAANKTAEAIDMSVNKASDAVVNLFKRKKKKKKKSQNTDQNDDPYYDQEDNSGSEDNIADMININTEVDPLSLPDSYNFTWLYTLQMQTGSGNVKMYYYLNPNASYFGAKPEMKESKSVGNIIMVMDTESKTNVIFMDMNGQKMAMPSSISVNTDFDSEAVENSNDFTFKEIGTKKIMGFTCQGYEMENDETTTTIYVTKDAPVSFTQLFNGKSKTMPKGFNKNWLNKLDNSLIMELVSVSKDDGTTTTMKCIALNQKNTVINTSDYKFMNIKLPSFE